MSRANYPTALRRRSRRAQRPWASTPRKTRRGGEWPVRPPRSARACGRVGSRGAVHTVLGPTGHWGRHGLHGAGVSRDGGTAQDSPPVFHDHTQTDAAVDDGNFRGTGHLSALPVSQHFSTVRARHTTAPQVAQQILRTLPFLTPPRALPALSPDARLSITPFHEKPSHRVPDDQRFPHPADDHQ